MFFGSRRLCFVSLSLLLLMGLWGCDDSEATKSPESEIQSPATETKPPQEAAVTPSEVAAENQKPQENPPMASERAVTDDPESQLQADLKDAISHLEQGDVAAFIEHYMPLEYVRNIRQLSTLEEVAKNIKTGGEFEKEWLEKLRAMQKSEPKFTDKEKSVARFSVDMGGGPSAFDLPNPADEKLPAPPGFAGDVPAVIGEAIAALEAGDQQKFIEHLFPASVLAALQSEEAMQGLMRRLKEHPQMLEQMLTDLKALEKLTPELNAEETNATFRLDAGTPRERAVQFEKAGTWRFADTAKTLRTQIYQQSQQPPIDVQKTLQFEWIRIRDHWRLSETD